MPTAVELAVTPTLFRSNIHHNCTKRHISSFKRAPDCNLRQLLSGFVNCTLSAGAAVFGAFIGAVVLIGLGETKGSPSQWYVGVIGVGLVAFCNSGVMANSAEQYRSLSKAYIVSAITLISIGAAQGIRGLWIAGVMIVAPIAPPRCILSPDGYLILSYATCLAVSGIVIYVGATQGIPMLSIAGVALAAPFTCIYLASCFISLFC